MSHLIVPGLIQLSRSRLIDKQIMLLRDVCRTAIRLKDFANRKETKSVDALIGQ